MPNIGLKQLGKNTSLTLSKQLIATLLSFFTIVLIARLLGPDGNGIYQMVILLPTLTVTLSNLGIGPATVYFVARKDYSLETVVKGNLIIGLSIGVFACIVAIITILSFGDLIFPNIPIFLLLIIVVVIPITLIKSYMLTIFQGLQNFKAFNIISIIPQVVLFVIVVIALWVLDGGVEHAVFAHIIANLAAFILSLYYLKDYLNYRTIFNIKYTKDVFSYGWKAHLSNILAFLNYRLDIFLVNGFLNPTAVGLYSIAVNISERLWMLSQSVSTVLLPRISELKNDEFSRGQITPLISRWILLITMAGSIILVIIAPYLIPILFGQDYTGAIPAFQIMLPGVVLGSASRILANDIAARGKPEVNMYLSLVALTFNVIGNIIFIPIMGIKGAALATTISYGINTGLKTFFYSKISNVKWHKSFIPEKRDFSLIMILIRMIKVSYKK